jgi:hypothetical protein
MQTKQSQPERMNSQMELRHLGREVKSAVELAIVGLCPSELLERLATICGLLDAAAELPADSPPVAVLVPKLVARANAALREWAAWKEAHLRSASA